MHSEQFYVGKAYFACKIVQEIIPSTSRCFHSPIARNGSCLRGTVLEPGLHCFLRSNRQDPSWSELHRRTCKLYSSGLLWYYSAIPVTPAAPAADRHRLDRGQQHMPDE